MMSARQSYDDAVSITNEQFRDNVKEKDRVHITLNKIYIPEGIVFPDIIILDIVRVTRRFPMNTGFQCVSVNLNPDHGNEHIINALTEDDDVTLGIVINNEAYIIDSVMLLAYRHPFLREIVGRPPPVPLYEAVLDDVYEDEEDNIVQWPRTRIDFENQIEAFDGIPESMLPVAGFGGPENSGPDNRPPVQAEPIEAHNLVMAPTDVPVVGPKRRKRVVNRHVPYFRGKHLRTQMRSIVSKRMSCFINNSKKSTKKRKKRTTKNRKSTKKQKKKTKKNNKITKKRNKKTKKNKKRAKKQKKKTKNKK
jgi:hypothetical protein